MSDKLKSTLPLTPSKLNLLQRHIAVPIEHGSWVFLLSPLFIGLFIAGTWTTASGLLVLAALAGFFFRQPLTIAVKVLSKRRPQKELAPALFWMGVYGLVGLAALAGLVAAGHSYLLFLGVPALPVLGWHLWLVSRREERRKPLVEIAGSGVLGFVAPAALWVGGGNYDPYGWLLWLLCWLQAAASIWYAYLRLEQRVWKSIPPFREKLQVAWLPLAATTVILVLVGVLAWLKVVPGFLPLAFVVQWAETLYGTLRPAVGVKPTAIGVRQLLVSLLFTICFIFFWIA